MEQQLDGGAGSGHTADNPDTAVQEDRPGLINLPLELVYYVTPGLSARELACLMSTCQLLYKRVMPVLYSRDAQGSCDALRWACHYGVIPTLERCLQHGASADDYFPEGSEPLVSWNRVRNFRQSFRTRDRNLAFPAFGDFYYTPLVTAIRRGHAEVVKILIDHGADVNKPDHKKPVPRHCSFWYPLHWALEKHDVVFEKSHKPMLTISPNVHSGSFSVGDCDIVRHLLEAGARVNQVTRPSEYNSGVAWHGEQWTPIYCAMNNVVPDETVELLVNAGADPSIVSCHLNDGQAHARATPLDEILSAGPSSLNCKKAMHLLRYSQTQISASETLFGQSTSNGQLTSSLVPLLYAAVSNWIPEPRWRPGFEMGTITTFLKAIVDSGAEPIDAKMTSSSWSWDMPSGQTALRLACTKDTSMDVCPVIRLLVQKGADPSARDWNGATALHFAAQWGHLDRVKELISLRDEMSVRLDVNAADVLGWTPLHYACQFFDRHQFEEQANIVAELLLAGANARARTKHGQTPLHIACQSANKGAVDVLLDHVQAADAEARDVRKRTPLAALRELFVFFTAHLTLPMLESVAHEGDEGFERSHFQPRAEEVATEDLELHIRLSTDQIRDSIQQKLSGNEKSSAVISSAGPSICYVINALGLVPMQFFSSNRLDSLQRTVGEAAKSDLPELVNLKPRVGSVSISRLI